MKFNSKRTILIAIGLIILVTSLTYLPNIGHQTYFRDDWYYMMDGASAGSSVFHAMFSIDRPARGYVFAALFDLFGTNPLPYHLTSYLWRLLGGLGAFWLFSILWPQRRWQAVLMASLFSVYPGYLWWVSGVEYQPMVLSLSLQTISIALTLQALRSKRRTVQAGLVFGAILSGWAALFLVEYAVGMEVFRLLCVMALVNQNHTPGNLFKRAVRILRVWIVNLIIPIGFLVWRLLIFQNIRSDTDVRAQLLVLWHSPVTTGILWLLRLIQSAITITLRAWLTPFSNTFLGMRYPDIGLGTALALTAAICLLVALRWMKNGDSAAPSGASEKPHAWAFEAIGIGFLGIVFGLLPVIMANRTVDFERFSHYALPASLAVVVMIVGLIDLISWRKAQMALAATLVFLSVATGYATSIQAVHEENIIRQFWHQVAWRAPGIRPGTTLLIYYPSLNNMDVTDTMWGAANLIYYPKTHSEVPVFYTLGADAVTRYVMRDVLLQSEGKAARYRTHDMRISYQDILVISQPSEAACVHVLDGNRPQVSSQDDAKILVVAPYSRTDAIFPSAITVVPIVPFGPEPTKTWCYYYQKADLAMQVGDWQSAHDFSQQAVDMGYRPQDAVEWLPLIQASAIMGEEPGLQTAAEQIKGDAFARLQACNALKQLEVLGYTLHTSTRELSFTLFCER